MNQKKDQDFLDWCFDPEGGPERGFVFILGMTAFCVSAAIVIMLVATGIAEVLR